MLRVLGRATSGNVQKVVFLLEELGQPYAREDYGRQFNNTQDAAYLKLNPNGKVPTLIDGEVAIWESNTIMRYICNKYGGKSLYPADPFQRSLVERWMDWQLSAIYGPYVALFKEAKKPAAERAASWPQDAKPPDTGYERDRRSQGATRHSGNRNRPVALDRGQGDHPGRRGTWPDRSSLPRFSGRTAGPGRRSRLARPARGAAGVQEGGELNDRRGEWAQRSAFVRRC
jgi:glutathione S-transferase